MAVSVRTQAELDKALADKAETIYIRSGAGVWLNIIDSGSSRVEAWGSSSVVARGSSRVVARGSSSVEARGSSSVEARGSSRVEASRYVAVHLHSKRVAIAGNGVVIDVSDINRQRVDDFLAYHGVKVVDGQAILYKAVDQDYHAGHHHTLTRYPIGETVTAPDWEPSQVCGNGLHFSYSPAAARDYYNGVGDPKFLEVRVPVEGLVALDDKAKSETCFVVREVDIHGDEVTR